MDKNEISKLAGQTQEIYERNARRFARERPKDLVEKSWLDRFLKLIPDGGKILDLGCGGGEPIAGYLLKQGYEVVGVDASANMIAIATENFPEGDWRQGDMRSLGLRENFDGIIGWNSFFHLTRAEQRAALPNIIRHLRTGGALLLTVGPQDGEVTGFVGDDPIYHASLSPSEYGDILEGLGLKIVAFVPNDADCYGMTILLGVKSLDDAVIG